MDFSQFSRYSFFHASYVRTRGTHLFSATEHKGNYIFLFLIILGSMLKAAHYTNLLLLSTSFILPFIQCCQVPKYLSTFSTCPVTCTNCFPYPYLWFTHIAFRPYSFISLTNCSSNSIITSLRFSPLSAMITLSSTILTLLSRFPFTFSTPFKLKNLLLN